MNDVVSDDRFLNDQFLIAMPALGDPNFNRSVTYICEHNDDGALGIVINKPMSLNLGDVFSQLELECPSRDQCAMPVLLGGPVQPERGFVLHRSSVDWDSSIRVSKDIQVTTSRDVLKSMADGHGPDPAIVALGYAGWTAGQLEREMTENAWLTVPASDEIIFEVPYERRWEAAAASIGVDLNQIGNLSGHA